MGNVEKGLRIHLEGSGGLECQTENGLDHPDRKDYGSGLAAIFDGEEDEGQTDGLGNCYQADLGGEVTGGVVTWMGTGMFAPRRTEICVQLTGQKEAWCCNMAASYSQTNVGVQLKDCSLQILLGD